MLLALAFQQIHVFVVFEIKKFQKFIFKYWGYWRSVFDSRIFSILCEK